MEGEITTASSRRLPIELCEFVIDAVYDFYYQFIEASLVTLSACALVCRAWRPHAQMILFDTVLVRDSTTLRRFAVLLDKSPHLRGYVHRLAVRGYLHVPTSPAVLFPTVVHLRLPNLTHIYLQEITPEEKSTCSLPPNMKELPSVPIHPYFPSLLATFNYVRRVDLVRLRFSSFADLCRVLSSLPNLPQLLCDNVSWDVFGTLPSFVWSAILNRQSPGRRKPFLPKLSQLYCYDMGEQGRQTLVASLGLSVVDMAFTFPNTPLPEKAQSRQAADLNHPDSGWPNSHLSMTGVDLETVPNVSTLVFILKTGLNTNERERAALRATLHSWKATICSHDPHSVVHRQLYFQRWLHVGTEVAVQDFISALTVVGPLVEDTLCELAAQGSDTPVIVMNVTITVLLAGDALEQGSQGRARIAEAFPTFSKHKRLAIIFEDNWEGG